MKPSSGLLVLVVAPLLMAALWMDNQPSFRPYEAPVLPLPADSVPVSGRESLPTDAELKNPVSPERESVARGGKLFAVNCALCHGISSAKRGPVGLKLSPPAPALEPGLVRNRSDSHIFRAITSGFGRMPSFRESITIRDRWDLVNFLRKRR